MDPRTRYRINNVSEQTGVPEATLRAWERRYHVPMPERTPSGYRLYSPRDVEQVRQIRERCEAGMSPAEAARRVAEIREQERTEQTGVRSETPPVNSSMLRFAESLHVDAVYKRGVASTSDISLLVDKVATIVASRHAGCPMFVVQSEKLQLYCAARHGDLLELEASVLDEPTTGVTIEVTCTIERLVLAERDLLTRTRVLLVPLSTADNLDQR